MPELPDVQVYKEYLDSTALHQRIEDVALSEAGELLQGVSSRTLRDRLRGRTLKATRRHGKHLFAELAQNGWLRLHFGMTGELKYYKKESEAPDHIRLRLDFSTGYHLAYRNVRKLGEIGLVDEVDEFVKAEGLGPDALDSEFDFPAFRDALEGRRGTIKGALMNQEILAGIGNVYADEILLDAGLHPGASVDNLPDDALEDLHRAVRDVLRKAIDARVEPDHFPRSFILPNREEGAECPRCGGELEKTRVSGRATYYCPRDQRSRT